MDYSGYKILVVDDEEDIREAVGEFLEDEGFQVFLASSGNEGFEKVNGEGIDLIVSDINMPNGSGVELLDNIKGENLEKPVLVFMTGFANISKEEAFAKGAERVFPKPVDYDALIEAVKELVESKVKLWQRAYERKDVNLEVKVESLGRAIETRTLNIARGGMFICLNKDLPQIGDELNFKINFSDENEYPFEGRCVVRWVRHESEEDLQQGVGVEFMNLPEDSIIFLKNYLKENISRTYIPKT